ncbi:AAA family ATPase [Streptomyces luteolus]|uniref:AAA family ATPase n=1 Tax=Streptomyces luteolus TaxID=3043615 RepID=A0ABT6SY38_9ACTN|nr:AAA family ATPase [Streptomyces sp. B-S-A12]MDI3420100.1 AAA family ATPase [Streptomyces sp. B-S-A12]
MSVRPDLRRSLIGRADESAALTRLISDAGAGHPSMALVEGPTGIGKTTLVDHVLRACAGRQPLRVVRGEGVAWEAGVALCVAAQLARACGADLDLPEPVRAEGAAPVLDAAQRLHRIWAGAQQREPLVVVVDDAHWADVESLRAMRSAVRTMSTERVLVLLIARDDPFGLDASTPPRTLEFLDGSCRDTLRLGPLGPEDVRALAWEAGGVALTLPAARHLCRHTRGNPRHATDLLYELPRETWQEWHPVLPAPARFAAAVGHRLTRCGEATRALVEACSVLDDDTPVAKAASLALIDDPLPAADEARAAGLLAAAVDTGRTALSFPHPLIRAAVLTGIGLTRRSALHRRAAEIAEDTGRRLTHRVAATITADAELADELDRYAAERASAGEWAAVADTLVKASRLSLARSTRQDRLLRAVDAMIGAGDVPQAALFAAELESFPVGTLRDVVLGHLAIMRGRAAEAETFLTRAWERCDPEQRPDLMARICQRRVLHALGRCDAPDLVAWARRAVELADPSDPSAIESEAVLGLGLAAMGRVTESQAAYEGAAAKLSGGAQSQRFQLGRGWVDLALDAPEAARRELEAAVPTGFRSGSTRISLWAQGWLARTQFALGAWQEAIETVDLAVARLADVRIELVRPLVHWTGAQIHALRGAWEAADHHVREAAVGMHHYEVMLVPACLARAQVAEARGEYERVLEALAPVVRLPSRTSVDEPGFWPWQDVYANALVMTNRVDEADTFLTPYEKLAALREHRSTMARLGLARGRVTGARGDIDGARREFEQALAHVEHLPLPYDRARVNFAYGQTLRRAGKRREADTVLRNARDTYINLGARTYVERCERELQAGGLKTSRGASGLSRLTAQEQAVARLVAGGASNKQAALELFIAAKTVQYHLTHIYSKLGIRSRSELAARFREAAETEEPR